MLELKKHSPYFYIIALITLVFPFFTGGYYVFYCAGVNLLMLASLTVKLLKDKKLELSYNLPAITIFIITLLYFFTKFWAVDKSMAFEGFVKLLTPSLYLISVLQIEQNERKSLINIFPISASIMTVLSASLGQIESLKDVFYDFAGDLHGCFEYANSYAMFVLVGLLISLLKKHNNKVEIIIDIICTFICAYGIAVSGSRAIMMLTVGMIALIVFFLTMKKLPSNKSRFVVIIVILALGIVGLVIAIKLGYWAQLWQYISTDGSMVERSLYYEDIAKYVIKHPFGKGAYAFYYIQPRIQSAYYYVIDAHNDYLQMAIEIGVIPALLFVGMLISQLLSKNTSLMEKMVLIALMAHCAFDYDLQFVSFWFILILCLCFNKTKTFNVNGSLFVILPVAILIGINGIICASSYCNYRGYHQKSVYYYKNTPSLLVMMMNTNDQQTGYELATQILEKNDSIFEANEVLSSIYEANDRYDEAIEQMELVVEKNPRKMSVYKNYVKLLDKAIDYYNANNESQKAEECRDKILSIPDRIKKLEESTPEKAKLYGRKQNFNIGKKTKKLIESYI